MRRTAIGLAAVGVAAFVVACWDSPHPTAPIPTGPLVHHTPTHCTNTTYDGIVDLVTTIYGPGSPNLSNALANVSSMKEHAEKQNWTQARAAGLRVLDQMLRHLPLPGYTQERFNELTNAITCYVNLAQYIGEVDPDAEVFVFESDGNENTKNVGVHRNGWGGIEIPGNAFTGLIVVAIKFDGTVYPSGQGPLKTLLDQYPGFFEISSTWQGNFLQKFVVGICAVDISGNEPGPLQLPHGFQGAIGHGNVNDARPFEVTEYRDPPEWLECPEVPEELVENRRGGEQAALSTIAMQTFSRTGFGGAAINNSGFGLVDARSGFGGAAINNSPLDAGVVLMNASSMSGCSVQPGTPVPASCRPSVTVATPLYFDDTYPNDGEVFVGVEVSFTANKNGTLAEQLGDGSCSSTNTGSTVKVLTNSDGKATVCWTVGAPGENKVTASPSYTGPLAGFQGTDPLAANYVVFDPASLEWAYEIFSLEEMNFVGFFRPVRMEPAVNSVKAGSSVPLKFSLGGDFGLDVFATGSPSVSTVSGNCTAGAEVQALTAEPIRIQASSLIFEPNYQYTYIWKTDKSWTGCRRLTVVFRNGDEATALFNFVK